MAIVFKGWFAIKKIADNALIKWAIRILLPQKSRFGFLEILKSKVVNLSTDQLYFPVLYQTTLPPHWPKTA